MALALLILFYTWLLGFVIALGGTILQLREENLPGVPWARVFGSYRGVADYGWLALFR